MNFVYFDLLVVTIVIVTVFLLISNSYKDAYIRTLLPVDYGSIENFEQKNGVHKYTIVKKQEKQYNVYDNNGTLLYNIIGSFPNLTIHDNKTDKDLKFSRDIDTQNYKTVYKVMLDTDNTVALNYNGANSVITNLNNYQELVTLTGKEFTYQNELLALVSTSSLSTNEIDSIETAFNEKKGKNEKNNNEENQGKKSQSKEPSENSIINMQDNTEAYIYLLAPKQVTGVTVIFPFIFQQIYLDIRRIN